jgi:hypothetical protein
VGVPVTKNELVPCLVVLGVLALFGCGPDDLTSSNDADTKTEETSSEGTSETPPADLPPDPPADLPADDPRWCIEKVEGAEVRIAMTDLELECDAEFTAEACEANQACTAVFGRPVQCLDSGACATGTAEFLGCVPFTICKQGTTVYCRESQGYLLTYASMQGDCTPIGMMACQISPDYVAMSEPLPECG